MNLHPPSGPTAAMDEPHHTRITYQIHDVGLSAYCVALAAWQRGLEVTFHYEVATKSARFAQLPVQGFRGELFSVSDGTQRHFFYRTLGDLTTRRASQLAENKQLSKQRFHQYGVPTPAGGRVARHGPGVASTAGDAQSGRVHGPTFRQDICAQAIGRFV